MVRRHWQSEAFASFSPMEQAAKRSTVPHSCRLSPFHSDEVRRPSSAADDEARPSDRLFVVAEAPAAEVVRKPRLFR